MIAKEVHVDEKEDIDDDTTVMSGAGAPPPYVGL